MRRLIAGMVAGLLLLATFGASPAGASYPNWYAYVGPKGYNGEAAILRVDDPRPSLGAILKHLKPLTTYAVVVRRGTCATKGTVVTKLSSFKADRAGKWSFIVSRTSQVRLIAKYANMPGRASIWVGTKCGTFGSKSSAAAPTPTPAPLPPGAFTDGVYAVGTTVSPGTYRASNTTSCYWARLSGFGGTLDEVIANDLGGGPRIVTISPTDVGIQSSRCGVWRLLPESVAPVPTAVFGEGVWRVGLDILPGTYQSTNVGSCYWARLSGFGGTMDEVISNDLTSGGGMVTIDQSDVGFLTRCGTWRLTGGG